MNTPSEQDIEDFTRAAGNGEGKLIEDYLEKYGSSIINEFDSTGHTALMKAVCDGRHMIMDILLKAGADTECKNDYDSTALMYAIELKNKATAEMLLQHGASFDPQTPYGNLILTVAEFHGNPEMIALLHEWHEKRKRQWAEDTDFSKGLQRPLPAPRPLKPRGPRP
jgi:ankyrin repeat protein